MHNPYWGKTFFAFFKVLFDRIILLITGRISFSELASDEVQLIVLSFIAISCAVLGVFLALKKMAMLANALSHTILFGIVISFLIFRSNFSSEMGLSILFFASFFTALVTAFFTQLLHQVFKVQEDAAIGLVFTFFFALGIVLATVFTKNVHIGLEAVMGNADALHFDDIKQALILLLINLCVLFIFFKPYLVSTFDPLFSKNCGISISFYHYLFLLQISWTAISSFRAVGVLLVLGFFVCPFLITRLFCHHIRKIMFYAPLTALVIVVISIALCRHLLSSYGLAFSTSSVVGTNLGVVFFILVLFSKNKSTFLNLFRKGKKNRIFHH